ncbi:glycerophosphodiester phosphodiesterase [Paenibacillus sambharensis]|uniref:Glycerophosphodiester phosphodiesterase n=1 Tax=Paenibacillus sambharensis TaxID=1803190 RepID=A0A2W1LWQ5_9BACL|nr:glycerophosphodiester phosphodiesterase [Paenibacillus sambharensis]PZD95937.1 glycerophosphodiester phosphodiesterase [Paenibacillus sambharensis]
MNIRCVAHRGASGLAPENTMAAMKKAIAYPFVDWIELDVQLSSDGIPVVIHDEKLRRTTGRRGRVGAFDAHSLNAMDAGSWFNPMFEGETIPRLEDVLSITEGRCRLNIELKTYRGRYPGMERAVVELLHRMGRTEDSVITSFDGLSLRAIRELSPDVTTGLIIDGAPSGLIEELKRLDAGFLSIGHKNLNTARMKEFRAAGLEVMAWTVNNPARMRELARMDQDIMICTNYPNRWEAAFQEEIPPRRRGFLSFFRKKTT